MGIRISIPPQMPSYIPKTYLGMPPLPFTTVEPFKQAKIRPPGGGKIHADTALSRIGNGGFKLVNEQKRSNGNRKVYSKPRKVSTKGTSTKAKKAKTYQGSNGKLVKKKSPMFQKVVKSARKAVSKYILGKGGRKLYRGTNGRFTKGG